MTEQELSLATSIAYLERAVAVADGSDLIGAAGQFSARAELAIALLLNGDQDRALALWDEAGQRLLSITIDDNSAIGARGLFLRHSTYFYLSAIEAIGLAQSLPPERRPIAPTVGQFHADLSGLGAQPDSSWRGYVTLLLGKIASVRGQPAQAMRYGQMATTAFAEDTGTPAAVLYEAIQLASGRASDDLDHLQ